MIIGFIPARYASTRFPGKPLTDINGKTMIRRVYDQCVKCEILDEVYVLTDDERIVSEVQHFGGKYIFTSEYCNSGTERCAEAIQALEFYTDNDIIVNIQGDEPFINMEQIELVVSCFSKHDGCEIATLRKAIAMNSDEITRNSVVKVVCQNNGKALYFSRYPIPFCRERENHTTHYKHIGIYAYRAGVLNNLAKLPTGELEKSESLEQLRWLENGYQIFTEITHKESIAIDTPDDVLRVMSHEL